MEMDIHSWLSVISIIFPARITGGRDLPREDLYWRSLEDNRRAAQGKDQEVFLLQ